MNDTALAEEVGLLAAATVTAGTPCDRELAATAKVAFVRPNGQVIALCQHHADQHGLELEHQGFRPMPVPQPGD